MKTEEEIRKYLTPKQFEFLNILSKGYSKEEVLDLLKIESSTFITYRYDLRKVLEDNKIISKRTYKKDYYFLNKFISAWGQKNILKNLLEEQD